MAKSTTGRRIAIRRDSENNIVLWDDTDLPTVKIMTLSDLDINDIQVLKIILKPELLIKN